MLSNIQGNSYWHGYDDLLKSVVVRKYCTLSYWQESLWKRECIPLGFFADRHFHTFRHSGDIETIFCGGMKKLFLPKEVPWLHDWHLWRSIIYILWLTIKSEMRNSKGTQRKSCIRTFMWYRLRNLLLIFY